MMPPRRVRRRESSLSIIADCAPTVGLTIGKFLEIQATLAENSRGADMA